MERGGVMYMYLYTCYMYMYPFLLPILALILLTLVSFSAVFDVLPELQSRSQQKEALNLLCLLLPRPNRDTLRELVEFLSRVALHSNDTILLDGTEVGHVLLSYCTYTLFSSILHSSLIPMTCAYMYCTYYSSF